MIKNNLIVIPFNLPWEWSTDYTNQTAYILAKKNTVICYMWANSYSLKEYAQKKKFPTVVKKHSKNIYLFYPLFFIPFRRFHFIYNLNQKLNVILLKLFIKVLSINNNYPKRLLWIFDPSNGFVAVLLGKSWKVIYDCVDFFPATGKTAKDRKLISENEKRLTRKAHLVTVISKVLQKHLQKYRKDVYLVPQGFRVQDFKKKKHKVGKIKVSKPVIGFMGAVNYRLDYNLLLSLAKKNPKWNLTIWGKILETEKINKATSQKIEELFNLPNVVRGQSKKAEVPGIISQFDIGIIPYDVSQKFNKYCYPMKLFEYFYMGKPVISTPIEELKRFPKYVKIGNTQDEWERIIKKLLSKPWPKKYQKEQKRLAVDNSWENKIQATLNNLKKVR